MDVFQGLPMAMEAARAGGSMPTVFNAANEQAVGRFLQGKIRFLEIYDWIRSAMDRHRPVANPSLETILEIEKETIQWLESR